jgi:hypothetical protein
MPHLIPVEDAALAMFPCVVEEADRGSGADGASALPLTSHDPSRCVFIFICGPQGPWDGTSARGGESCGS